MLLNCKLICCCIFTTVFYRVHIEPLLKNVQWLPITQKKVEIPSYNIQEISQPGSTHHSKCTTISTHTDNCQKHPTTSCLHGFTQAAISSFTYILPNHNTCKIPSNLYQLKYHFSQKMFQIPYPGGIKLSQSCVLTLPLSQHLSVILELKKLFL